MLFIDVTVYELPSPRQLEPRGLSTRIKDAGIANRHSRGYIISVVQALEMGLRGVTRCVHRQEIVKMDQFSNKINKI